MSPKQNNTDIKKQAWLASRSHSLILDNVRIAKQRVKNMKEQLSRLSEPKAIVSTNFMTEIVQKMMDDTITEAYLKYYKAELAIWICVANYDKIGVEKWLGKLKERGAHVMEFYEELGDKVYRKKYNKDGTFSSVGTDEEYRIFCEKLQLMITDIEKTLGKM